MVGILEENLFKDIFNKYYLKISLIHLKTYLIHLKIYQFHLRISAINIINDIKISCSVQGVFYAKQTNIKKNNKAHIQTFTSRTKRIFLHLPRETYTKCTYTKNPRVFKTSVSSISSTIDFIHFFFSSIYLKLSLISTI